MNRNLKFTFKNKIIYKLSSGSIVGSIILVSFLYFIFLVSKHNIFSLYELLTLMKNLTFHERLTAIAFIPLYFAFLIMCGVIVGGFIGDRFCQFWCKFGKKT
jgi:hypothetical protein